MIYEFKKGARVPANVTAEDVANTLLDIKDRYGKLTADVVAVDYENDPCTHPLRWGFTQDPVEGMHKLHVIEAGDLIRVVVVKQIVPDHDTPVRAFVVARQNGEPSYEQTNVVLREPDLRAQLMEQVDAEFDRFDAKRRELMALVRLL